jgi:hypothetical protein
MSHDHRDEHELADVDVVEPEPIVPVVPVAPVANSEAERRAEARRKAEGVAEQSTQHQFTGDLPEPDRGGTDTEQRIVFAGDGDSDDATVTNPAGATRRGPPPPRTQQFADEGSWAAPATLDALGASAVSDTPTWLAPSTSRSATVSGGALESWATSDR